MGSDTRIFTIDSEVMKLNAEIAAAAGEGSPEILAKKRRLSELIEARKARLIELEQQVVAGSGFTNTTSR